MISMARTFGAPETVPAGKQASRPSNAVPVGPQPSGDSETRMHDVRETLSP